MQASYSGRTLGLGALRRRERSHTPRETLRIRYTLSDRYTLNKRDEREESSDDSKEDKRVFLHPECVTSKSRSRMNASRRLEGQKKKNREPPQGKKENGGPTSGRIYSASPVPSQPLFFFGRRPLFTSHSVTRLRAY
jgi:hypothetical protein